MEVSGKGLTGLQIDFDTDTEDEDEERESNGKMQDFRDKETRKETRALAAESASSNAVFDPPGINVSTRAYQAISPIQRIGEEGRILKAWSMPGLKTQTNVIILQDQYWYSVLQLILFF
jgi:hypothetical protein